jgi:hypothetical protein
VVRFWWGVVVGGADDPTAEERWMLVGGDELGGFPLLDRAGPDDPTVQCELAVELMPDAAEDLDIALAGVGVDGRDHATPSQGVDADEDVTDGQSAAGPGRLGIGGHPRDEEVGAEPADVVAEGADGAVGGDEEVEHVESLGAGVGGELGVDAGVGLDDLVGLDGGPGVGLSDGVCNRA